jgi:drug/metabolite transporter (DMT)-like permease
VAADLALVLVSAIWGTTFFLIREAVATVPPFWFVAIRFLLAALTVAVAWRPSRRLWRQAGAAGVLMFLGYAFQTFALKHTGPDEAAFITSLSVVLVPFGEWFIRHRRPPARLFVAALLSVGGLWLLLSPSGGVGLGDWLVLCSAFGFAGQILATDGVAPEDAPHFTGMELLTVALLASLGLPFSAAPHFTAIAAVALLFTALAATALAIFIQTWAQSRTSPTHVALIFTLEPWFAALATSVFAHQGLAPVAAAGGAVTFLALLLAESDRWGKPRPALGPTDAE